MYLTQQRVAVRAAVRPTVAVLTEAGAAATGLLRSLREAGERPVLVLEPGGRTEPGGADPGSAAVLLIDLERAGELAGVWRDLAGAAGAPRLLAMDAGDNTERLGDALSGGITSFVRAGAGPAELRTAVNETRLGRSWVSPVLVSPILEAASARLGALEAAAAAAVAARPCTLDDARRVALETLRPVFQPIVELGTRGTVAMLALSRFADDPEVGVAARYAEARRLGFATDLEIGAAHAAIAQVGHLPGGALLFVKVSSATVASGRLDEVLPDEVMARVVLEVSEHHGSRDEVAFATAVARLRDRGMRFSVDETGAGFGALDRVLDLAPSFIRLAGGLTRGIDTDRTRRALALAVISFASHLGARVIADQIETEDELRALRRIGVDLGLGYYVAPPGELAPPDAAAEPVDPAADEAVAAAAAADASSLIWASTSTAPLPVTARMLTTVERASRDVLRLLARHHPGLPVYIAHLDRDHDRRRIVAVAGAAQPGVHPGVAVPAEESLEGQVAAGQVPQAGAVSAAGAPEELAGTDFRAWITVPFAGTPAEPAAFVTLLAPTPGAPADVLEVVHAAAGALRAAVEAEFGGRPDALVSELRELSWRDRFTGLLNAARFSELLGEANARAVASSGGACVLQVRLANFGTLCDRLGQAVGELVLKDVAHALARNVDDVDTVAYIDGSTLGCLLFGRSDKEIGHLCREVVAEVATLSRRRGAVAELRAGSARLGLDPSPVTAWQAAGERLADPPPSP